MAAVVSKKRRAAAKKSAQLLKTAASETRLLILSQVSVRGGAHVGEIARVLGMTHSAVSHQLGVLSEANIVVFEKEGRTARYFLASNPAAKQISRLLKMAGI